MFTISELHIHSNNNNNNNNHKRNTLKFLNKKESTVTKILVNITIHWDYKTHEKTAQLWLVVRGIKQNIVKAESIGERDK